MIGALVDDVIGVFSPLWQLRRTVARSHISRLQAKLGHSGLDALGGSRSAYQAAGTNRLTVSKQAGILTENQIPRVQIQRLRSDSWDLFRNNPHARKIVRQLESKVIGRGLQPLSLAVDRDGSALPEWRKLARKLWRDIGSQIDFRGKPGRGGQHLVDLEKLCLRSTILGGEVFVRLRNVSTRVQERQRLILPLQIQMIHPDRLDEQQNDERTYYGIEFSAAEQRIAYHFLEFHPADDRGIAGAQTIRVPSEEIIHVYVPEDIDQIRGVPWFSAALLKMRDVADYEYNELQSAAMAACVVLGYRRSTGQTQFGVSSDAYDLTDASGNTVTNISPGMILDLGSNGEIQSFDPQRPNNQAGEFIAHMVRSEATSVAGIKATTLTGDYREASFSSEKSADNDAWPELEGLQDWLAWTFCQPLYEEIIDLAVQNGYFDGVDGFSALDYSQRRPEYLLVEWRGPVSRSINPKDDAEASLRRMKSFTSSPQREAAELGRNWEDILEDWSEFMEQIEVRDIPEEAVLSLLGIKPVADAPTSPEEDVTVSDHWIGRGVNGNGRSH